MAESAESQDCNVVSGFGTKTFERRVCGYTGTEERGHAFKLHSRRNSQDIILIHRNAGRVSTVGWCFAVLFIPVVGYTHPLFAELLFIIPTGFTFAAGINETADADGIACTPFADLTTDLGYRTDNLVAGNHWEN